MWGTQAHHDLARQCSDRVSSTSTTTSTSTSLTCSVVFLVHRSNEGFKFYLIHFQLTISSCTRSGSKAYKLILLIYKCLIHNSVCVVELQLSSSPACQLVTYLISSCIPLLTLYFIAPRLPPPQITKVLELLYYCYCIQISEL